MPSLFSRRRTIRYQLTTPLVAITKSLDDAHPVILTLEAGTIVTVVGEAQRSGLVDVLYKGDTVAMFMRDLQDRAELIEVNSPLPKDRLGDDSVR